MAVLGILLTLQCAAALAGGVWLWRRIERQAGEIAALRSALAALTAGSAQRQRRAAGSRATVVTIAHAPGAPAASEPPAARAERAWSGRTPSARGLTALDPAALRGAALGVAAAAPALASLFGAAHMVAVASGLCIAAGMMALALRQLWRAAAWAAAATGGVWALAGLVLRVGEAQPGIYCAALALATLAGLAYACLRERAPGAALAVIASGAALMLGGQIGMIGAPGIGFGVIVATAAIAGAQSLKLEGLHAGAFIAALAGLFVLSGQPSAAIWFTPAAAWAGALFFAIAAVCVPRLGARGVALAGAGALAPLLAIAALYASNQGLADRGAAGAAFAVLALLLGVVLALSAQRNGRGVAALKLTLWLLASAAFVAAAAGVALALPAPLSAATFAAMALGLVALDRRLPHRAWRMLACAALAFAVFDALVSIGLLLSEAPAWNGVMVIASGLAIPSALVGGAAFLARRNGAPFTAALSKIASVGLATLAANMIVRLIFSGGALLLEPIGFVETGFHAAAWLAAALVVAAATSAAHAEDNAAVVVLGAMALGLSALSAFLWLTPYWSAYIPSRAPPFLHFAGLGFAAPAALFWAHWVFWRSRGSILRTRAGFGAAAALTACLITFEGMQDDASPDTISVLIGTVSLALAAAANFAPGITARPRRSHL